MSFKPLIALGVGALSILGTFNVVTPNNVVKASSIAYRQADNNLVKLPSLTKDLESKDTFELNGVKYNKNESNYQCEAVTDPTSVTDLVIYDEVFDKPVSYAGLSLTNYTNLKRVIIKANLGTTLYAALKDCPSRVDLYLCNQYIFNTNFNACKINTLYLVCPYKNNYSNINQGTNLNNLSGSDIKSIKIYNYNNLEDAAKYYLIFNNKYQNKDSENIACTLYESREDVLADSYYDLDMYAPYDNFNPNMPYFGITGTCKNEETDFDLSLDDCLKWTYISSDPKLEDLYIDNITGLEEVTNISLNNLVIENYDGEDLSNVDGNTLSIKNELSFNPNLDKLNGFEQIRFYPADNAEDEHTWTQVNGSTNTFLKFYLPTDLVDTTYLKLKENCPDKIETYDPDTLPLNRVSSFNSTDGNTYKVADNHISITEAEDMVTYLKSKKVEINETDKVDLLYEEQLALEEEYENITPDEYEDVSEFIQGLNTIGSLYYSSNRNIEDILKIASQMAIYQDGEIIDSSKYKFKYHLDHDDLSLTVLDENDDVVASTGFKLIELDDTYGEFIYSELFGTNYGTLLLNTDDRDINMNDFYTYLMNNVTNNDYLKEVNITGIDFTEPSIKDISTYYHNKENSKFYEIKTKIVVQNFELFEDFTNVEINVDEVISPDDDYEDAESEYDINHIEKIYVPKSINATAIPNVIKELILLKNGELVKEDITVVTSHNGNIQESNYTFNVIITLPDKVLYKQIVEVEMLKTNDLVGFTFLEDETLITITKASSHISLENLELVINNFLKDNLDLTSPAVIIDKEIDYDTTGIFTNNTYNGGKKLILVNSGNSNLNYSSSNEPVNEDKEKEGYHLLNQIYFTANYKIEDVIKALANKILLQDGIKFTSEYNLQVELRPNNEISFKVIYNDEEIINELTTYHIINDSKVGPFIFAKAMNFKTNIILLEQNNQNSFEGIYKNILETCDNAVDAKPNQIVDLTIINDTKLVQINKTNDGNYYNYDTTVYVINLEEEIKEAKVEITIIDNKTPGEVIDDIFNDFKDEFENNNAFKIVSMVLGTLLGVILIYLLYKLIQKIIKWVKR